MTEYKRILIKISGEALSKDGRGIDAQSVSALAAQLKSIVGMGIQVGVVVGGGNFWRGRTSERMDRATADYIGMMATVMNGLALGEELTASGVDNRVVSSLAIDKAVETYFLSNVKRYLDENKLVIFVGGTGNPYFSTDTALTLRACEVKADAIFCLKNVDGIYDSDPKLNPKAKKYDVISCDEIIAKNLKALDLTAIAMCKEFGVEAVVVGKDVDNAIIRVLNGEKLGTIIK